MTESLYTYRRGAKHRGPTTSEDYNNRIEENYRDLVVLYNRTGGLREDAKSAFSRFIKENMALQDAYNDLESRLTVLEAAANKLSFRSSAQIDVDRFDSTAYEITSGSRCYHDMKYGQIVLPKSSSTSKLRLTTTNGDDFIPSSFAASAVGVPGTLDDSSISYVQSSDPQYAVLSELGKIWERSVIATNAAPLGAAVDLYIRIPVEFTATDRANALVVDPFPALGCSIESIEYTTASSVNLNDTDSYLPLNYQTLYPGDSGAVGWLAPGAWAGDEIIDSGLKTFYFDPINITGLKIRLRQKSYFEEGGKVVYSYGLSNLDLRYDSFNDMGKTIIRYDAPAGYTISSVSDVQVDIFNVPLGDKPEAYSYRVIWETAYDSGSYTTSEVALSKRVWVELTLNKTTQNITPAVSGIVLTYS